MIILDHWKVYRCGNSHAVFRGNSNNFNKLLLSCSINSSPKEAQPKLTNFRAGSPRAGTLRCTAICKDSDGNTWSRRPVAQHIATETVSKPWLIIADLCPLCPDSASTEKKTLIELHFIFCSLVCLLSDIVVSCHIVTNIQIGKVLDVACPKFETLRIMRYNKCLGHQEKWDLYSL